MMSLTQASTYFDRTPAYSVTNGALLFKCQIDPYDDSKRDASAAYRRILSVAPGTVMPAEGAFTALSQIWLIGGMEPDGLEQVHRQKYVILPARTQLKVSRPNQYLSGTYASIQHASAGWVKDAKQLETSSEQPQIYDVFFHAGADVRERDILWNGVEGYLALSPRRVASDLLSVACLRLEAPAGTVSKIARTYNPSTGAYADSAPVNVQALVVRWQSLYKYGSQADARFQEGDLSLMLPTGTVVDTTTKFQIAGFDFQVLSVDDLSGVPVAHIREL